MVSSHEEAVAEIIRIANEVLQEKGEGDVEHLGDEYNIYGRTTDVALQRANGVVVQLSVPTSLRGEGLAQRIVEAFLVEDKKCEIEKIEKRWECCRGPADLSLPNKGHADDCRSSIRFGQELRAHLNLYQRENISDTPDRILADYMMACLGAFEEATNARSEWYEPPRPAQAEEE